jgi:hypothetical protein
VLGRTKFVHLRASHQGTTAQEKLFHSAEGWGIMNNGILSRFPAEQRQIGAKVDHLTAVVYVRGALIATAEKLMEAVVAQLILFCERRSHAT